MKLKSYFSSSVESAMEQARKELGEDALLINVRPATPETRYLGAYEVVFGLAPTDPPPPAGAPLAPAPPDRFAEELADLRRQMARLALGTQPASLPAISPHLAELDPGLEELDPGLAKKVAAGARLTSLFSTDATLGRIVALVGPPGAGKTTTLIKLAARYGLARRDPVRILTADVHRIAAAAQLRSLAAILGIRCEVCETPAVLHQLLEQPFAGTTFIDTPGFSFREMEDAAELAAVLAVPAVDTHLVLPASMKPQDLSRAAGHYEIFRPSKLLFTRLDETSRYGALISESARRKRPISFLTTGQQIPDDLEEASTHRLAALLESEATPLRMGAAA